MCMNKRFLVLLIGAGLVAPLMAYSSQTYDRPQSITLILEIEHIQREKLSNGDRTKLAALTQALDDAANDAQRKSAERQLASFRKRTDRTRALLLFGRATYWIPKVGFAGKSRPAIGDVVPMLGDHPLGAFRRDDAIIVGVESRLVRRIEGVAIGEFVSFMVATNKAKPWASERINLTLPDSRGHWKLRARQPLTKIDKPTWWPAAPNNWSPVWKEPNHALTKISGLRSVGDRKEYGPGYRLIFQIHNGSDRDITKALVWFRLLDGDGDIIGRAHPRGDWTEYIKVGAGETVEVSSGVSAAVYEVYASAELSVELAERPTK